jgi:hypothetical protein
MTAQHPTYSYTRIADQLNCRARGGATRGVDWIAILHRDVRQSPAKYS